MITLDHHHLFFRNDIVQQTDDGWHEQDIEVTVGGVDLLLTVYAHAVDGPSPSWTLTCARTGNTIDDDTGALRSHYIVPADLIDQLSTELAHAVAESFAA